MFGFRCRVVEEWKSSDGVTCASFVLPAGV